jgi:monoamine oxidase
MAPKSSATSFNGNTPSVIVVGAGISGLTTAKILIAAGYNVTILEARNRIGGRICTNYDAFDFPIEIGAAWIHGIDNNPLSLIAQDAQIAVVPYKRSIIYTGMSTISGVEADDVDGLSWDIMHDIKAAAQASSQTLDTTREISVKEQFYKMAKTYLDRIVDPILKKVVFKSFVELQSYFASNFCDMSFCSMGDDVEFDGDHCLVHGGYDVFLKRFCGPAVLEAVRLNCVVEQIIYSRDYGVTVVTNQGEFNADRAVLTFPLGVLKRNVIQFSPALPAAKQEAINRLGFGHYNKVYLEFDRTFWPSKDVDFLRFIPQSDAEWLEYEKFAESPSSKLDGKANFELGYYFLNLLPFYGKPVLACTLHSAQSLYAAKLSDEEVVELVLQPLRNVFGSENVPAPLKSYVTRWYDDPYTYGSYASIPVTASGADMTTLSDPIDNLLFFAGEATFVRNYATVHGAYLSGLREGERILDLFGCNSHDYDSDISVVGH